ncbi:MAG: ATP-binding cassette domain-containing protein [Armatimonadetes bacterium]|nr:ATP-binding cassette domain-containing protein [Armatimonadota bacterium]MDE2207895.1 ATP-binding cassette domain-containing protein [Armatimonadota bacterium]
MESPLITCRDLTRVYRVHERESGGVAAVGSLFKRKWKLVPAVTDCTFDLAEGEIVGFLGPNGAGKTTTLKMLSGLLFPTSGEAHVMGHVPWKREPAFLQRIAMVMGNRQQLMWDIPAMDSFLVNQAIYQVPEQQFRATVSELVELLELGDLIKKPVRGLSLGERMKCELAASLLHSPPVLFLDEPTLGVDVTMQGRIRQFIGDYNRKRGATILLTSHYMADVTALCKRVIVINTGRILYDGELSALAERIAPFKLIKIDFEQPATQALCSRYAEVVVSSANSATLKAPRADAAGVVARIIADLAPMDLTVEDPPIEEIIQQAFRPEPE